MRKLALILIAVSALAADPKGFTDIFPGKDFKRWTRLPFPPTGKMDPVSQWKLDPSARVIVCEGDKGHEWLRYDRELADFILHVEWRFIKREGEPKYNSGVFVRNSADGSVWHQAQAGLAGGWLFGATLQAGEAKRFNLRQQMKENRVKPAGEWNTYQIRAEGRTIALSVNGTVVSELTECEVPRGYIGLEAEGFPIEFRNIRVKQLTEARAR